MPLERRIAGRWRQQRNECRRHQPKLLRSSARPGAVRQHERKEHGAEDDGEQSDSRFHGTVLSLLVARTARPGDACSISSVGRCYLLLFTRPRAINSRRRGTCGPVLRTAIADYRIICVLRGTDGDLEGVGYAANGNAVMYDDIWTVEQARAALAEGHRLYTLSPEGGYAQVELTAEGIRATSDHSAGDTLDDLPTCG